MKAILVIDTGRYAPRNCLVQYCVLYCPQELTKEEIETQNYKPAKTIKRMTWEWLKPMPQKIDDHDDDLLISRGWNACLDEILGDYITQEEADLCGVQFWHDD